MQKLSANQSYQLPQLSRYIDAVGFYRNQHQRDSQNILFEGCPEGVFELIFQSDQSVWQKECNDKVWRQRDEAFVGGLHQQSFQLKLPPETEVMSVRFKHGAFKYVFAGRLNEFVNEKVPLTELWSSQGKLLPAKIKDQLTHHSKVQVIAAFIEAKINEANHSIIDQSVQSILGCHGMIDMSDLEQQAHLSPAQFRKRFREEVGLSPKKYAKVIKINAILAQLDHNLGNQTLTDIVYHFGYFDQSHFIKDFKSVIGKTPTQFKSAAI